MLLDKDMGKQVEVLLEKSLGDDSVAASVSRWAEARQV